MMEDVSGLFSLGEVNVTSAIQGIMTTIVVPELTGYLMRTALVAANVDPMQYLMPVVAQLAYTFGFHSIMDRMVEKIKNGL